MIQIRNGLFETNSSSANVLIIPKNQGIVVPKRFIFMDDGTSKRPAEWVMFKIIHGWDASRESIDQIINFLYNCGVEEIIYGGNDSYIQKAIDMYKGRPDYIGLPKGWTEQKLKLALFGDLTEIEFFGDGDYDRPNYDKDYNVIEEDDDNFYKDYYAG